jgi:hypothetical protein
MAMANSGTPLMWASVLHMAFGNAIIGVIEGLLLAWIFKCPKKRSILILIVANYVSAWVGRVFVVDYLTSLQDITIESILFWFMALVGVAFFVTLLIEFPFFWFALRSRERPFRQALKAIPLIHGISYALLFWWYWSASGTSMMTRLQVTSPNEITLTEPYHLYYLSSAGDQVLRMDLNDPNHSTELVTESDAPHRNDRLFAREVSESDFDLFVRLESEVRDNEERRLVLDSFSERAPIGWRVAEGHSE